MKTTIDIPDQALADAMRFTGAKTKREAVVKALEEFNRQQRVKDLVASFGTLDFASNDEIEAIKKVCKDLLAKLKTEKLVLAWRSKRTTRAAVRVEIEKILDSGLPEKYTTELFEQKCGVLFQHVLEKYPESGESVYLAAAG